MREGPRLVIATRNPGKLAEFRRLLAGGVWSVVGLEDTGFSRDVEEPFDTYAENARVKAATVAAALDAPVLADDSGIEVDALGGWPGPLSARWMGDGHSDRDRLDGLRAEVTRRCPTQPQVRYVCVLALARPGAEVVTARGETLGTLVEPRGDSGFGYDPAFLSVDTALTFAEATVEQKDEVSHRGRALRRMAAAGHFEAAALAT
ncbi:MAG: non-canonical purine NTP pyrophosphatase [Candidatus Dormibacteria bacterium]